MTRLAISGHRELPAETERIVEDALGSQIDNRTAGTLVGISCLADGADAIFAKSILKAGGSLEVIVPAEKYRDDLPADHHATYDALMAQAANVTRLDHVESDSDAHMEASMVMLDRADELLAVWDGQPARGYGGTADIVEVARQRGMPVTIVWPAGSERG
jgi:hypothetical protein